MPDLVIVGAGPTGLGAASRVSQLDFDDWVLLEASDEVGGLSSTYFTKEKFAFDLGGHVIFSHYTYFNELLQEACGSFDDDKKWITHQRNALVRYKNEWVPYPFQNNLAKIPLEDQIICIKGLLEQISNKDEVNPKNFDEWIVRKMGVGLAEIFMRPYNFKVWACPPSMMQCGWLGERVATVDASRVVENVLRNKCDRNWGPNNVFRFPHSGGTGGIWKKVACLLPSNRIRMSTKITRIFLESKEIELENSNERISYKKLMITAPLDLLLSEMIAPPYGGEERSRLLSWSSNLRRNSTHVVGIGFRGECPHGDKCWLYFPEELCEFYRVTVFSNYGPGNAPDYDESLPTLGTVEEMIKNTTGGTPSSKRKKGPYWSLMYEISESDLKSVDVENILRDTLRGSLSTGLVQKHNEVVSVFHKRLEHGYPVPSLRRDDVLTESLSFLEKYEVYPRGRFGCYKYEVGNQDHSVMLGVEWVDRMKFGTKERTMNNPGYVNRNVGSTINDEHKYKKPPK